MKHLSNEQLNNYAERKLSVKEMLDADRHLALCDACRINLANLKHTSLSSLVNNFREAADTKTLHLTYEELSGYVKKNLDVVEREIVESHAENCHRCAKELKDLQAFVLTLNEEKKTEAQKSFLQMLLAKIGLSTKAGLSFGLPQLAAVMGVIVMFTGAAFLFVLYSSRSNQQPDSNQNRIVQNRAPNPNFNKPTPKPSPKTSPTAPPANNNKNSNEEPKQKPPVKVKVAEPQSTVATFILTPGIARDGKGKKMVIKKNIKTVRLVVGVAGSSHKNYKAVLRTAEGTTVFLSQSLKAVVGKTGKSFTMSIPAKRLESGDYLLVINGITVEEIDEQLNVYQLRVMKK